MADAFRIIPPQVRAEGKDVPPEQIQAGFNALANQVTAALNSVASDPTGPAGGDLSGTYPNPTVSGVNGAPAGTMANQNANAVNITGGAITNTPISGSTGAFTSAFASGGAVPAVATTGTQIYNSPNPTVQFIDSIRSTGNKNAYATWGATILALGFANDAFTSFTNALTITGGFASGISGITSNSGSGTWVHTGAFSATSFTVTTAISVASGGTGRSTLTAHGVLIGEGTSAINQTTAGTAGQPLLSGGASADPNWGTLAPAAGGTGLTSITAHGVMLGQGTSAVTAVAPNATTGLALIAQGAASDPIFGSPTGVLLNVQRITTTGTYTPTAGTNSVIIYIIGGGGGGGGAPATGAGQVSAGGSGGSGGIVIHRATSGFSGVTVTIGGGGTAGGAGTGGGSGGNSTFGAVLTAGGGGGGASVGPGASFIVGLGSAGGASSGGNISNIGSTAGYAFAASTSVIITSSNGNMFVPTGTSVSAGGNSGAAAGSVPGGGGIGAINGASASAAAGAAGAAGLCIIYEYA